MQTHCFAVVIALIGFLGLPPAKAAVRYDDVDNLNPTSSYTNWATAATMIQDAIDVVGGLCSAGARNTARARALPVTSQNRTAR